MTTGVRDELDAIIKEVGEKRALEIIKNATHIADSVSILTIVANEGSHHLPDAYKRGVVHVASRGNLDFSSPARVYDQYQEILSQLASVLKSRSWSRIYLVPFGHATLAMQIKLLVYRITRIETVDLFYDGKGGYSDLEIDLRQIIVSSA